MELAIASDVEANTEEHEAKEGQPHNEPIGVDWGPILERVLSFALNESLRFANRIFVGANHYQVLVEVKCGVEVPEEYSAKAIVVRAVRDRLDSDEAVGLAWFTVQVASWLNDYFGALQSEFEIPQHIVQ